MIFVQIVVLLVVIGVAWYFLEPYVKSPFREMIIVVAVLGFCIWLLNVFGIVHFPEGLGLRR